MSKTVQFDIVPVAPFRLDLTTWTLRRRQKNIVDQWDGSSYRRVLILRNKPMLSTITASGTPSRPLLQVKLQSDHKLPPGIETDATAVIQPLLGTTVNLQPFYRLAKQVEPLTGMSKQFRGMKPPRYPTLFETLTNAVACQQVSLESGISSLNRMTEAYGLSVTVDNQTMHAFPRPEELADLPSDALKGIGFSHQKSRTVTSLAHDIVTGAIDLTPLETASNEHALKHLLSIHGIGRWSAEYALLRGLGRLDTFPGDDVGAQNNLQHLFQLDTKPNYESILGLTSTWHPYAGLVYFHMLLQKLAIKELI